MGRFTFHVAASFIGKDRPYDPTTHLYHFDPKDRARLAQQPKSARPDSGHDAFFVRQVGESGVIAVGVADGVGGWTDSGVDPADFSHGLCNNMADIASGHRVAPGAADPLTARKLLEKGYQAVCEDRSILAGGSTACVALASPEGVLEVANLGDSGFIHLRLNAVHAYSEPQTHAFNTPFQLSVVPPSVAARMAVFGGSQLSDFPRDADVTHHTLQHGDVLVFASDGVWDNLFNQDILRIASQVMKGTGAWQIAESGGIRAARDLRPFTNPGGTGSQTLQSILATQITGSAKTASVNRHVDGPFAKAVQMYFPQERWRGGKVDDICVVVVVVSDGKATDIKSKL